MDIHEAASILLLGGRHTNGKKKRRKELPAPPAQEGLYDLSGMNGAVESLIMEDAQSQPRDFTKVLPPSIWEEWLWRSNPNEPPTSDALLNRNQLLGLLICR